MKLSERINKRGCAMVFLFDDIEEDTFCWAVAYVRLAWNEFMYQVVKSCGL